MKETGIIMSGNHPKLILDGIKTMTRRVIKPNLEAKGCQNSDIVRFCNTKYFDTYMCEVWHPVNKNTPLPLMIRCPYGQVGQRLWVRETYWQDQSGGVWCYKAGGLGKGLEGSLQPDFPPRNCGGKLVPSLFMPRWASRTTLEITGIRVERLQEITVKGAIAEGCVPELNSNGKTFLPARGMFKALWDSLNAKRGYGWKVNPWVWVISFKKGLDKRCYTMVTY